MSIIKGKNGLSLNVQHDYITLKTPNGNYTTSWGGAKSSGKLTQNSKAFNAIDRYVETKRKSMNFLDVMKSLLEPKVLSLLWEGWNEEVKPNNFVKDDKVKFIIPVFSKRYPNGGTVVKVSRKNVFLRLVDTNQVIGFDYNTMVKQ